MSQTDIDPAKQKRFFLRLTRKKKIVLLLCLVLLVSVSVSLIFYQPILRAISAPLVINQEPKPCDIICVLGGGGRHRVEKAIDLYKEGYSHRIFIALPETIPQEIPYRDLMLTEKVICRGILEFNQIPPENISWSESPFFSTLSEIEYLDTWLPRHGHRSAIVVSGWYQSQRARWTIDRVFGERASTIQVVPAPIENFDPAQWWKHEEGIVMVQNEWIKNIYYILRGAVQRVT